MKKISLLIEFYWFRFSFRSSEVLLKPNLKKTNVLLGRSMAQNILRGLDFHYLSMDHFNLARSEKILHLIVPCCDYIDQNKTKQFKNRNIAGFMIYGY